MKIFKRIASVLLILVLFIGSFLGSFLLFNKGSYDFDVKYLSVFDETPDHYYLQKAPRDIKFRVMTSALDRSITYKVNDASGNTISLEYEKVSKDSYNILPPSEGYQPGERYTLTLGESVSFADKDLENARVLVFCIEREEIEAYKFTDLVVETPVAIQEIEEDRISIDGIDTRPGEILFGTNTNNDYVAYKIGEIADDGTAHVTIPALDEIYSELDLYGEYELDIEEIVANPDLEIEIIENIKQSNFYTSLIREAYASEEEYKDGSFEVKIKPDKKTNTLDVEIKITLKPGEDGLFGIAALRDHKVTITLNFSLGLSFQANIKRISDWDIAISMTTGFSWDVDIAYMFVDEGKSSPLMKELFTGTGATQKQNQKNVKAITDSLNKTSKDSTSGEIYLFKWDLPIPSIPGLRFGVDVKLFAKLDLAASISIGQEMTSITTIGACFTNGKFNLYSNTYKSDKAVSLSLRGKASIKAGIKLVASMTVISSKIAKVDIDPQAGLYADLYVTIPILSTSQVTADKFIYSYFEPGFYVSAKLNAYVNLLLKQFTFSLELFEKKFPIKLWTLGNDKIATALIANASSVRAVDNVVNLPDILFEYYDVKDGISKTDKLAFSDLKFRSDDATRLDVSGSTLTLPSTTSSEHCYITASYLHSDGQSYSTVFRVLISGSMLEGKVSAYNEDLTTRTLDGAEVKLYTLTNATTPVSTQKTDENGKFSFNVSEGNYRLVISADGYRTLSSSQRVEKDEIKYTEHILLMENSHFGNGSAGGTVTNALTGKGISNVRLKLRQDWNNTTGQYVSGFSTTTDSSGRYQISNVPVGYYTVEASLDGYITGYANISVLSGRGKTDFDFTITPVLAGDEIRIVLTWGATPRDLDSHLIGRTPSDGTFNVYYYDMKYVFDGREMANLDVDDTTSYGPETITILENIHGAYTYAVHDYTNRNSSSSNKLSLSDAVVRVFIGSRQVAEYHVPTDQIGTYWTVFQINKAGRIRPVNTVSNTKPTP
ncbi:MAG TPA: carboxypeptidase regulatory-like domain-containing protein [Bacillota bacterium]|nr:carboxypeptidase regulatory-like domain-containing protein [Bacillota bacterium]